MHVTNFNLHGHPVPFDLSHAKVISMNDGKKVIVSSKEVPWNMFWTICAT
jgi:hypothetical protein